MGAHENPFPTRNILQKGSGQVNPQVGVLPNANSTPDMISMSSFVPSAHVLSTSFDDRSGHHLAGSGTLQKGAILVGTHHIRQNASSSGLQRIDTGLVERRQAS